MRKITKIRTAPVAGFNVLALMGADVLFIKQDVGRQTTFVAYLGDIYYSEQTVTTTVFKRLVEEIKTVAKNVSVEEKLNPLKVEENVCTVYSKPLDYDSIDTDKLISATRALVEIEKPFNNELNKGSLKDLLETRKITKQMSG